MLSSILLVAATLGAFALLTVKKIKADCIFLALFLLFSVVGDSVPRQALIFAILTFALFLLVRSVQVNHIIKASYTIYIISVFLLVLTLVMPSVFGTHRYLVRGFVVLYPAALLPFSLFPICTLINGMKRITFKKLFALLCVSFFEIALVVLQNDLTPAVILCITILILLNKAGHDQRLNVSRGTVTALNGIFILGWVAVLLTPYARNRVSLILRNILTRGAFDPQGAGYELYNTDSLIRGIRFIGPSGQGSSEFLRGMPLLSLGVRFRWIAVFLLVLTAVLLLLRLYLMSNRIQNSFARYVCFGVSTYFSVSCAVHIFREFAMGASSSLFLFAGGRTGLLINALLLAIVFVLYTRRDKITVGRQLDIDYDMTDAVLTDFETTLQNKLENAALPAEELHRVKECLEFIEIDRESRSRGDKTLQEVCANYHAYESVGDTAAVEKDLVFISYNHFDEKHAAYLAEQLEAHGLRAWHFKRDMKFESDTNDYAVAIRRALKKTRIFVVLLSSNSMKSEHVKNEVCLAFNQISKGTILLPVLIEKVSIDEDETYGYYLCRQDVTNASEPPVKKQLDLFVQKVINAY